MVQRELVGAAVFKPPIPDEFKGVEGPKIVFNQLERTSQTGFGGPGRCIRPWLRTEAEREGWVKRIEKIRDTLSDEKSSHLAVYH